MTATAPPPAGPAGAARSAPTLREAFSLGDGDLLVMGGSFRRTHEHAVGKTARAVGPRISVQYRPTSNTSASDRSVFTERA